MQLGSNMLVIEIVLGLVIPTAFANHAERTHLIVNGLQRSFVQFISYILTINNQLMKRLKT